MLAIYHYIYICNEKKTYNVFQQQWKIKVSSPGKMRKPEMAH